MQEKVREENQSKRKLLQSRETVQAKIREEKQSKAKVIVEKQSKRKLG